MRLHWVVLKLSHWQTSVFTPPTHPVGWRQYPTVFLRLMCKKSMDCDTTERRHNKHTHAQCVLPESGPASGAGPPPSVVKWKFTKTRQRLNQYTSSKYHQYISRAPVWTQIAHFTQAARCLPLPDHTLHQGWPAWDQAKRGPGRGLWIATHWTLC